jgi:MFS family permease
LLLAFAREGDLSRLPKQRCLMETVSWNAWRFFRFSLLWLSLSALWTALLSIVLPAMADIFAQTPQSWGRGTLLAVFSGVGATVSALTQVLVGWRSDHDLSVWRRWRYLLVGFPLMAFPLFLLAKSTTPLQVVGSLVLLQVAANMATGPYQALIPDEVPPHKHGLASTWMGLFQHAGQVLGPVLAAVLLGTQLSGLLQLEAVLYAGLLLGLAALWSALPPGQQVVQASVGRPGLKEGLRRALGGDPNFRLVLQSRLIINIGFYLVVNFLLFYVQYSLGYANPAQVTMAMLSCMVVGGLVGGLAIGPRADRGRKLPLIYLTCGVTALGMSGFVALPAGSMVAGCVFAGVAGFGFGGFSVVDWSLACNLAPKASSALSMGIWNLAAVVPQVIAPGLFGPASDLVASTWGAEAAYRLVMASVIVFLGAGSFRLRNLRESAPCNQAVCGR